MYLKYLIVNIYNEVHQVKLTAPLMENEKQKTKSFVPKVKDSNILKLSSPASNSLVCQILGQLGEVMKLPATPSHSNFTHKSGENDLNVNLCF